MSESSAVYLVLGIGVLITLFLAKSRWNYLRLPSVPRKDSGPKPDVTVIIPARNEAATIARCIGSFPGTRVIVVDDDSGDSTARTARSAGAQLIHAPPLAPGSMGKPNACWAGAQLAATAWLLFVDADTWYDKKALISLLDHAGSRSLDMLSVFLHQERVTLVEDTLVPYSSALYFCGVSAGAVARGRQALANGQCLLFRREAYLRIGGHKAVADAVLEDVELAALARDNGLKVEVARGESLGRVRMHDSLAAIARGFEKSFRVLMANRWPGLQLVIVSALLTTYLPLVALLLFYGEYAGAAIFGLLPAALLLPWYGGPSAILSIPAIYLFELLVLKSMAATLLDRKVQWKGRPV